MIRHACALTGSETLAQDLVHDVFHPHPRALGANRAPTLVRPRRGGQAAVHPPPGAPGTASARPTCCSWWRTPGSRPTRCSTRSSGLPYRQRAALVLQFYECLPQSEIADILHCSRGNGRVVGASRADPAPTGDRAMKSDDELGAQLGREYRRTRAPAAPREGPRRPPGAGASNVAAVNSADSRSVGPFALIAVAIGAFVGRRCDVGRPRRDDCGGDPEVVRGGRPVRSRRPHPGRCRGSRPRTAAVSAPASDEAKVSSIQLGQELAPLLHRSAEIARRFGYTDDQLAGNVVTVSDPSFIDATHAIVKFSLTIPDHGTVVRDRVGYARPRPTAVGKLPPARCATSCGPERPRRRAPPAPA